jgi:hypothetical protein
METLWRQQDREMFSDHFVFAVAQRDLRAAIPSKDTILHV